MPFVANQQIRHNHVLAYNPGDPVHPDNVARHGYDKAGLVDWIEPDADGRPEALQNDRGAVFTDKHDEDQAAPLANPEKKGGK